MDYIDLTQWPAMLATMVGAWLVGSQFKSRRRIGFWVFLLSNILWVIWGVHVTAYAVIVLQLGLAGVNIRGSIKNS